MWSLDEIAVELEEAEGEIALVRIAVPRGTLRLIGVLRLEGDRLIVSEAHVEGLDRGVLGRSGLNAIGRKLLVVSDAKQIVIYGGVRTTGRNAGRRPRPIRFPT